MLLITLDTMRADRLPAYGFPGVETPALDRLAAEGTVFEEAYAAVPLTLPSHASLFTGLYPPRLGVRDNSSPPLAPEVTTLAEILRARGLRTAAFVGSAVLAPGRGLEQGFDVYSDGDPMRCPGAQPARRRAEDVVDETLSWLAPNAAEPFFAWVHFFDAHRPYDLPAGAGNVRVDPYSAALAYEDSQIARLIDYLDDHGALDNTLVIVAGDHGESLGDHGEDAHGIFVYQEALRVPLIARGPGVSVRRVKPVARLIDVMPTVLDLFRVPARAADGVSLARTPAAGAESDVYAESMYGKRFGWAPLRSLRADQYKFIDAPRPELYDLSRDPREERNVIAAHPAVAGAMRARLRSIDADRGAAGGADSEVDRTVMERIAALGYVTRAAMPSPAVPGHQIDPKDRIAMFNRITRVQWANSKGRGAGCR